MSNQFICSVAKVLSPTQLVISKGSSSGLKDGMRFLIYKLSDEDIIDPQTKENLGKLEIVKGTGRIIHLQEKMATIESDKFSISRPRKIIKTSATNRFGLIFEPHQTIEEIDPEPSTLIKFDSPEVGDLAKQIP